LKGIKRKSEVPSKGKYHAGGRMDEEVLVRDGAGGYC